MTIAPGTIRTLKQKYVRRGCDCGNPATKCHTYLLPNARRNPASKGYGKDNISWCSDEKAFTCSDCPLPTIDGHEWCATFDGDRFPHMVHTFITISQEDRVPAEAAE
ncbi:hypothetical protein [Pseudohoeflea coraliihabitans]|uniref:Uncharacterized protein n=1 Tax=Pseudohoeflea coraliihabitans TaxID=2860393 RepID=A0ABS6WLL2_9HYPH|nr:hypothetical protein [Pseudohoeflea sp. DP4N28-3]MBW3096849.1 hypothetical protein [Pseudohoeflea sp. DP4N28-3]